MRRLFIILPIFFLLSSHLKTNPSSKTYLNVSGIVNRHFQKNIDSFSNDSDGIYICEPVESVVNWKEWEKYLQDNLVLDSASMDTIPAGTYKVFVSFEVDENGKISRILDVKDPGYDLGLRAANIILQYKGWKPSDCDGRKTKSYHRQPLIFIIEEMEECKESLPIDLTP